MPLHNATTSSCHCIYFLTIPLEWSSKLLLQGNSIQRVFLTKTKPGHPNKIFTLILYGYNQVAHLALKLVCSYLVYIDK